MFILVTQADGSARRLTWVTYAIAVCFIALFVQQNGATLTASDARREAVAFLNENPHLKVAERYRGVIPLEYAQALNNETLRERAEWGLAEMPEEIVNRGQREFDAVLDDALVQVETLPIWKYGVRNAELTKPSWWAHVAAHETKAALMLSLVLLLCLGIALEDGWGRSLYAGLVAAGVATTGIVSAGANYTDSTGLPWYGASGLIATLMGAYFVRSLVQGSARAFGVIPLPGVMILPIWLAVEYIVVRGVGSPDEFVAAPAIVHGVGFGFGAVVSALIVALRFETKMLDRATAEKEVVANPTLERAMVAKEKGRAEQAYDLLRAEFRRTPNNPEVAIALWDVAVQIRKANDAVEPMVVVIESDLKAGRASAAVSNWFSLVDEADEIRARPQVLVRMGEVLLDEGHPQAALKALALAIEGRTRPATPLLMRAVRIARDLDPALTLRAATLSLQDNQLGVDDRSELTKLCASIESGAQGSTPAVAAKPAPKSTVADPSRGGETTNVELEVSAAGTHGSSNGNLDSAELDPQALDLEANAADLDADSSIDAESLEAWNDSGRVDSFSLDAEAGGDVGLDADLDTDRDASDGDGDFDDMNEFDESDLVEALMNHEENFGEETTSLADALAKAAPSGESITEVTMPTALVPSADHSDPADSITQPEYPSTKPPLAREPAVRVPTTYRQLRIREGIPASIESTAIVIEVEGGKKTRLPFARIEAMSAAVVAGLGAKPIVIVDLIVNWSAAFDPIKVIRLRSDRFDPAQLVPGQPSQLDALRKMLATVLETSRAAPLPDASSAAGSPFKVFDDLDTYNRTVLGGVNDISAI